MSYQPYAKDHICMTSQGDIAEICRPLFEKLDLNYFHYYKPYLNGSAFSLYSRTDWHDYYWGSSLKREATVSTSTLAINKINISLWEHMLPSFMVEAARLFEITRPISINIPHATGYQSFTFAAHSRHVNVINDYFNQLDVLIQFCRDFVDKAAPIIAKAESSKIVYPKQCHPVDLKSVLKLSPQHLFIKGYAGDTNITFRELEILRYFSQGLTANEMAIYLSRSRRTIEAHITNLKKKLGCKKRSDLMRLVWQNQLFQRYW